MSNKKVMMSKYYFEKYAQLTLGLTDFRGNFVLSDKPDLQNFERGIGIEVVTARTTDEGIFDNEWNRARKKGLTSKEFLCRLRNPALRQKVFPNTEYMFIEIGETPSSRLSKVINAIKNKSQRFANYKRFDQNGLYLYTRLWQEQIPELQQAIQKNNFMFDFYILNLTNKLLVLTKNSTKIHDMPPEQIEIFQGQARNYEESLHK